MSFADLKAELMRAEFPTLRPDHDPDIERYFDMRSQGRPAEALAFYNRHLSVRYPDPDFRTRTLRAYRLRSPEYASLIAASYDALGDRLLERTKRVIKYIALHASSYDPTDVYQTIRAAEAILRMLPNEQFAAIAAVERFRRYADALSFQKKHLERAEELVRAYLTERLDVVEAERARRREELERAAAERRSALVERDKADTLRQMDEASRLRARREAEDRRPRRSAGPQAARAAAALDLSTLRFSAQDLARIQIPPTLTKIEDKTLAFCFKYWNLVNDEAFERVLFLYSRKFGVKHYDVFRAIRDGRRRGRRDEEILAAVSALLTTGYYYSIRGDLYLQQNWAILKGKIDPAASAPTPDAAGGTVTSERPRRNGVRRRKPAGERIVVARRESDPARKLPAKQPAIPPAAALTPVEPAETAVPTAKALLERSRARTAAAEPAPAAEAEARIPTGSVADRLRKLSGRSYDVFQDRFLAKARAAIRSVLSSRKRGPRALFATIPLEAENLVYEFLKEHYDDPYMDWEGSEERKRLAEHGFDLESADPVIADCYKRL